MADDVAGATYAEWWHLKHWMDGVGRDLRRLWLTAMTSQSQWMPATPWPHFEDDDPPSFSRDLDSMYAVHTDTFPRPPFASSQLALPLSHQAHRAAEEQIEQVGRNVLLHALESYENSADSVIHWSPALVWELDRMMDTWHGLHSFAATDGHSTWMALTRTSPTTGEGLRRDWAVDFEVDCGDFLRQWFSLDRSASHSAATEPSSSPSVTLSTSPVGRVEVLDDGDLAGEPRWRPAPKRFKQLLIRSLLKTVCRLLAEMGRLQQLDHGAPALYRWCHILDLAEALCQRPAFTGPDRVVLDVPGVVLHRARERCLCIFEVGESDHQNDHAQ